MPSPHIVKAPIAESYNWTGFDVGATAGYGWDRYTLGDSLGDGPDSIRKASSPAGRSVTIELALLAVISAYAPLRTAALARVFLACCIPRDFGRKQGMAEVDGQPPVAERDAHDPRLTSTAQSRVSRSLEALHVRWVSLLFAAAATAVRGYFHIC